MSLLVVGLLFLVPNDSVRVTTDDARLLGSYFARALSLEPRIDVISAEDVRRAVEFEGQRQTLGCSTSSCLAELAGAMGADIVVFGDVGLLGDRLVLSANLFDASKGTTPGRAVVDAKSITELTTRMNAAADELLKNYLLARPLDAPRVKVVLLDLVARGADASTVAPTATAKGLPWPLIVGGSGAALAALAVAGLFVSAAEDGAARDRKTPQEAIAGHVATRDGLGTAGVIGLGLGVTGVGAGIAMMILGGAQ